MDLIICLVRDITVPVQFTAGATLCCYRCTECCPIEERVSRSRATYRRTLISEIRVCSCRCATRIIRHSAWLSSAVDLLDRTIL